MTRREILRHNAWQAVVSLDQVLHCLGGLMAALLLTCVPGANLPIVWADETLSSRCWRWHVAGVGRLALMGSRAGFYALPAGGPALLVGS